MLNDSVTQINDVGEKFSADLATLNIYSRRPITFLLGMMYLS